MFGAARERHRSHQIPPQRQKKCSEKKGRSKNMNTILLKCTQNPLPNQPHPVSILTPMRAF